MNTIIKPRQLDRIQRLRQSIRSTVESITHEPLDSVISIKRKLAQRLDVKIAIYQDAFIRTYGQEDDYLDDFIQDIIN